MKRNSKEIGRLIKEKMHEWIYAAEVTLQSFILKILGLLVEHSSSKFCRSMSPDGRYAISWSWDGLIYLIYLDFFSPLVVISFVFEPGRGVIDAEFSKDMQQIIIRHNDGSESILSAVPAEGYYRRPVPIMQPWVSLVPQKPPHNIVELITDTSSAYWQHIDSPEEKSDRELPTPLTPPLPGELDYDWDDWVAHGERFLDLPRGTCGPGG